MSLRLGAFELAILDHDHPTIPARYRALLRGVILNIEVEYGVLLDVIQPIAPSAEFADAYA
ncbi:MAG: hypothetical protein ACTJGQ_11935 [Agrococcus casei]|uniref:hypothetical protein n=1 Tax=Agrococcus casei TaxID=343512 RepID=UPI003F91A014